MDEAVEELRAAYDAVPYESHAFPQTAPGHLAAIAYLFGLDPVDVPTARVLEIGCAAGGNLIPFAALHPEAHVVGIDLSSVQVGHGQRRIRAFGLRNLELVQGDIAAMDLADLGQFDFIICHGVYSWVPPNVQEAILSAFDTALAPNGVAYVSYNVYPGWKSKEIVRDAMLLRAGDRTTPEEKLDYARGMIAFFEGVAPADSVVAKAIAEYRTISDVSRDSYILHEYLESFNSPCYFLDFGKRTEPYRLTYLGDSTIQTMFARNYGKQIAEPLLQECGHSQVLVEQYLDFFRNRAFRQTLLVHGDLAPQVTYNPDRARFARLHLAAFLPPADGEPRLDGSTQEYGSANFATQNPVFKAALAALTDRWPWTLSRAELLNSVYSQLDSVGQEMPADLESVIDQLIEQLVLGGAARFRLDALVPPPTAVPLRLDQAIRRTAEVARDDKQSHIFNLWHETVWVTPVDVHILPLLDGTRDREALVKEVLSAVDQGLIGFARDGQQVSTDAQLQAAAAEYIDGLPRRLAEMKLARLED